MNEEDRIRSCLETVSAVADEIIVFDSGSADRTLEIVKEYTDKVWVTDDWPGDGIQKQRALDEATCDWVLLIDADEWLDDDMSSSIRTLLARSTIEENAFRLPWGNLIAGRQMKFGRSARAPKRLFRRNGASISPAVAHAAVMTAGKTGKITHGFLMHDSLRGFDHLLEKNRLYSWETTLKYRDQGKRSYGVFFALVRSLWTFLWIYIVRLGFLDGSRGLMMAVLFAQASFNKYTGLWYLEEQERQGENDREAS
jgi:glycosyltransferase involved in cell wall biosynthesis